MFILLALLGAISFALQGTLMASVCRRMNPLLASSILGLSFAISMSPLLLLAGDRTHLIAEHWHVLLGAAVCTMAGNWGNAAAVSIMAVGTAGAIVASFIAMTVVFFGFSYFHELLSWYQVAAIAGILVANFGLSVTRPSSVPIVERRALGVLLSAVAGILCGIGDFLMSVVARQSDPFVAGYLWNVSNGLLGVALVVLTKPKLLGGITLHDFFQILLFGSPVLVGVGCYSYAITQGPVGIVTAVNCTGVLVAQVLFAWLLYREKLTLLQGVLIALIAAMLVVLKVTT